MHDFPHHHHERDHRHGHHHHDHRHDHAHPLNGHNGGPSEHLHSHVHGDAGRERREELKALTASFVEGFRKAADKTSYLRVAGVPFQIEGEGGLTMHLVDTAITTAYQLGTASPGFGTRELSYLPYPGEMVSERETMTLTYVSMTARREVDIVAFLAERLETD